MSSQDPRSFTDEQREAWSSVAPAWYQWWGVLDRAGQPVNERLVEMAGIEPGHRVLDLASGIGEPAITAGRAVGPGGSVAAYDLSPEMVRFAEKRAAEHGLTNVEFAAGDAETLELPGASFDAAVCRWGLMLMGEPQRALATIRGALRPGARLAAAVWGPPERVPFLSLAARTLRSVTGAPPPDPDAPGPMRFGAPGVFRAVVEEGGFVELTETVLTVSPSFESVEQYLEFISAMSSSLRKMLEEVSERDRARFFDALREAAGEYADDEGRPTLPSEVICVAGAVR